MLNSGMWNSSARFEWAVYVYKDARYTVVHARTETGETYGALSVYPQGHAEP